MFTIDLYTVLRRFNPPMLLFDSTSPVRYRLEYTCRETFADINATDTVQSYLTSNYPSLDDTLQSFERLKIRAEVDLVVRTARFVVERMCVCVSSSRSLSMRRNMRWTCLISYFSGECASWLFLFRDARSFYLNRLSEFIHNPYLRQRQVDLSLFNQINDNDEEQQHPMKMSSKYIPLLPKDLCHIPLRPIDDDSLANMNKRSRLKGRFPFHLPSFLHKRRFFSMKSASTSAAKSEAKKKRIF